MHLNHSQLVKRPSVSSKYTVHQSTLLNHVENLIVGASTVYYYYVTSTLYTHKFHRIRMNCETKLSTYFLCYLHPSTQMVHSMNHAATTKRAVSFFGRQKNLFLRSMKDVEEKQLGAGLMDLIGERIGRVESAIKRCDIMDGSIFINTEQTGVSFFFKA